ncbi:DUF2946 family protein [Burkholderiaceae bacterium DAT-1]|nr:DUF2946 family protein [Burkholderiaceae bacterium DAT-1]
MDEMVRAAMLKWPNVPDCYGWLELDARGQWRTRGEVLRHPGLCHFISRNYLCDAHGNWYFQNGPQRVFVALERAPLIGRMTGHQLDLHTGLTMVDIESTAVDDAGHVWCATSYGVASLHDHDLDAWLEYLGSPVVGKSPEDLLAQWLAGETDQQPLWAGKPLLRIANTEIERHFGFIAHPQP